MIKRLTFTFLLLTFLTACGGAAAAPGVTPTATPVTAQPSVTPLPATPLPATLTAAPGATATLAPDAWMDLPVVPTSVSQRVKDIYALGQTLGNNPHAFSKLGDCDTSTTWFLQDFDNTPAAYVLGPYAGLQAVIDYFHGSYGRTSVAAVRGAVAASMLSPIWNTSPLCLGSESPMACEVRLNHPSFVFVSLGTNDYNFPKDFEPNMRKILDSLIAQGIVPILSTKADDTEGDNSINATIARLAYEYQLPLWNFWRAAQPLPDHGLQTDLSHLTFAPNDFTNAADLQAAWPWRNLTALQTLDVVWRGVTGQN